MPNGINRGSSRFRHNRDLQEEQRGGCCRGSRELLPSFLSHARPAPADASSCPRTYGRKRRHNYRLTHEKSRGWRGEGGFFFFLRWRSSGLRPGGRAELVPRGWQQRCPLPALGTSLSPSPGLARAATWAWITNPPALAAAPTRGARLSADPAAEPNRAAAAPRVPPRAGLPPATRSPAPPGPAAPLTVAARLPPAAAPARRAASSARRSAAPPPAMARPRPRLRHREEPRPGQPAEPSAAAAAAVKPEQERFGFGAFRSGGGAGCSLAVSVEVRRWGAGRRQPGVSQSHRAGEAGTLPLAAQNPEPLLIKHFLVLPSAKPQFSQCRFLLIHRNPQLPTGQRYSHRGNT